MTRRAVSPAYPTDIVTDNGWERIHQGHNLDVSMLLTDLNDSHGDAKAPKDLRIQEVYFWYQPRVMWCGKHGDACDSEGEWHAHWHAIRPVANLATMFTLVR